MPRISLLDFNNGSPQGLWISGPRERTPQTHLRRFTAPHQIRERELRTRNGTTVDTTIAAAHSLGRFDDVRFQGATTILYRAGVSIDTGYDGTPLEMAVSEPRVGTDAEYLFVCGGGKLTKVEDDATVTQWGISPPSDAAWGTAPGGDGEESTETVVNDPQERTVGDTTSTTGWFGFPGVFFSNDDVLSASGGAVCQTYTTMADDEASAEEDGLI